MGFKNSLDHNCCGATEGSKQQHNQDLKEIYQGIQKIVMLQQILLILAFVRRWDLKESKMTLNVYLHVGKYQNNYYQSIERTRWHVVQKMTKWLSTLVFPQ